MSLYAEAGGNPLNLRRTLLYLQFFVHIEAVPTSPTYVSVHAVPLQDAPAATFAGHIHSALLSNNLNNINVTPVVMIDAHMEHFRRYLLY